MTKLFPEYKRSTVYALIGVAFHSVVVVLPFSLFEMYSALSGKGYGGKLIEIYFYFVFFIVYFPFQILDSIFSISEILIQIGIPGLRSQYIFLAIAGTLFYTLSGWLIGYLTKKYS
jgi:hypothetical protein